MHGLVNGRDQLDVGLGGWQCRYRIQPAGSHLRERHQPSHLFSEIGISLLVTTLVGVLAGYWIDQRLGTVPIFVIVGFLAGAGSGSLLIYRLVSRFLKTIN
jgi:F0F1-type ATP synthase assembly protein I